MTARAGALGRISQASIVKMVLRALFPSQSLTRTGQLTGGTPRVLGWEADDITVTITCPTAATSQTGIYDSVDRAAQINVSTTVDYVSLFGGVGVINDDADLRAVQQATVMGI